MSDTPTNTEDSSTQHVDLETWQRAFLDRVLDAGPSTRFHLTRNRLRRFGPYAEYPTHNTGRVTTVAITDEIASSAYNNIATKPEKETP